MTSLSNRSGGVCTARNAAFAVAHRLLRHSLRATVWRRSHAYRRCRRQRGFDGAWRPERYIHRPSEAQRAAGRPALPLLGAILWLRRAASAMPPRQCLRWRRSPAWIGQGSAGHHARPRDGSCPNGIGPRARSCRHLCGSRWRWVRRPWDQLVDQGKANASALEACGRAGLRCDETARRGFEQISCSGIPIPLEWPRMSAGATSSGTASGGDMDASRAVCI